jgi:hypothetical protein
LVVRHKPDIAFDPAGPFATRVAWPLPVTGGPPLVLLLSLKQGCGGYGCGNLSDRLRKLRSLRIDLLDAFDDERVRIEVVPDILTLMQISSL